MAFDKRKLIRLLEMISRVIRGIAQCVFLLLTGGLILYHALNWKTQFVFKIAATVNLAVWMVISYIVYMVFSVLSYVPYQLLTAKKAEETYSYLQQMVATAPKLTLNVSCYHLVTRLVSVRNNDGTHSMRNETQRVTTHSEQREFNYMSWEDISDSVDTAFTTQRSSWRKPCLSLQVKKSWVFTDEPTLHAFKVASDQIQQDNRYRDRYMDYYEDMQIDGFQGFLTVFANGKKPFLFGIVWWLLATLLMLNIPYCFYIDFLCQDMDFSIKKRVSVLKQIQVSDNFQPVVSFAQAPDQNPRQDTGHNPYPEEEQQQAYIPPTLGYQQQQYQAYAQQGPPYSYQTQPYYTSPVVSSTGYQHDGYEQI